MNVYSIIINWNNWEDTLACVNSLLDMNLPFLRIVLIDNASTDGSVDKIDNEFSNKDLSGDHAIISDDLPEIDNLCKITIIKSQYNRGFAGGNNLGLNFALKDMKAKYFWLLNNDTIVDKNALNELIKKCEHNNGIGLCGSRLVYHSNRNLIQAYGSGKYNKWTGNVKMLGNMADSNKNIDEEKISKELHYIIGASMFVTRNFIKTIGLMDESYFLYYEDCDWAIRGWGKYLLSYCDKSIVYHKEGASIGGSNKDLCSKSIIADYYYIRNKLLITKKHFPWAYIFVLFGLCGTAINRIRRKQYDRLLLIVKIVFYSIFRRDKIFISIFGQLRFFVR